MRIRGATSSCSSFQKTIIIVAFLCIFGFFTPFRLHAQAPAASGDTAALIRQLQEQVKFLQTQIVELKTQIEASRREPEEVKKELRFGRALQRGSRGDEVRKLQEYLAQFPEIYPEGLATGYYGPLTEAAVRRLQEKEGIELTGALGTKTLKKLNELVGVKSGEPEEIPSEPASAPSLILPFFQASPSRATTAPAITRAPESGIVPASTSTPRYIPPVAETLGTTTPAATSTQTSQLPPVNVPTPTPPAGPTPASPAAPPSTAPPNTAPPSSAATTTAPVADTSPPIISNVLAGQITQTSAVVSWSTNEPAASEVAYAALPLSGTTSPLRTSAGSYLTSHSVTLSNLVSATSYYFVSVARDQAGNSATSTEQNFATASPPPPPPPPPPPSSNTVWSNVQITNFSGNGNLYYGEYPALAWNGSGYGVVWTGDNGTAGENIFFKKLDTNGNPIGDQKKITAHGHCGCLTAAAPNIVWNGSKYGIAWTDYDEPAGGQNMRFGTLDAEGSVLTNIKLSVSGDNTTTDRPELKWSGTAFLVGWRGSAGKLYAEVASDGQAVTVGKKVAADSEWNAVQASGFSATVSASGGTIYFTDSGKQEVVSTVPGYNSWPFITWTGAQYGVVWQNVQNNMLQLYFASRSNVLSGSVASIPRLASGKRLTQQALASIAEALASISKIVRKLSADLREPPNSVR